MRREELRGWPGIPCVASMPSVGERGLPEPPDVNTIARDTRLRGYKRRSAKPPFGSFHFLTLDTDQEPGSSPGGVLDYGLHGAPHSWISS